jgi:hypothetical protein
MKLNKTLLALLFGSVQFAAFAQSNYLYGLISTPPTIPMNTSTATTRYSGCCCPWRRLFARYQSHCGGALQYVSLGGGVV